MAKYSSLSLSSSVLISSYYVFIVFSVLPICDKVFASRYDSWSIVGDVLLFLEYESRRVAIGIFRLVVGDAPITLRGIVGLEGPLYIF